MHWRGLFVVAAFAGLLCGGCGSGSDQRFIPSDEVSQETLDIALTAWQNGASPPCPVRKVGPGIQLVDTHHQKEQTLSAFTVLGPTPGDAQRCYAVRLTFDNPRQEVRARFVILGQDPLWVLRYEDYEMLTHWDHPMPAKDAPPEKSDL